MRIGDRNEGPAQGAVEPELKLSWAHRVEDGAWGGQTEQQPEAKMGNNLGAPASLLLTRPSKVLPPEAGAKDWHPWDMTWMRLAE